MAESPKPRRLSGLAQSIDSLFAPPPPPAADGDMAQVEAAPTEDRRADASGEAPAVAPPPLPPTKPATLPPPLPTAEPAMKPPPLPPVKPAAAAPHERPEMFPLSQMLPAIQSNPWSADTVPLEVTVPPSESAPEGPMSESPPLAETLLTLGPPHGATVEVEESGEASAVDESEPRPAETLLTFAAPVGTPGTSADGIVPTPRRTTSDDVDLRAAVEAFVTGDAAARAKIESAAAPLKERLALDPLADAVERLVREAGDPPNERYLDVAAAVLNPAVASRLVQRMGQERDESKLAGYFSLCRRLGRIMANALKGALTGKTDASVRRVYYDALISMGETSRPVIEGMAQDENRLLVRDAVVILSETGGPRAVELVTSALADNDSRVRTEALHALAKIGDAEAGSLVLGFLGDSDEKVRVAAAEAAGRLKVGRALRPMLQLLESEASPEARSRVVHALGDLGDASAVPALEKLAAPHRFGKTPTEVRVAAYRALHRIGTPHARELVQQAANDKDPGVRAALRGLARAESPSAAAAPGPGGQAS